MTSLFSKTDLKDALTTFQGAKVGIIGDVMLDCYIYGSVDRVSPEAPVPIVEVTHERLALGGAANVANNVKALGGDPYFISVSGDDVTAAQIEELFNASAIKYDLVKDHTRPTTLKTRIIGQHQQIVRFDREQIHPVTDAIYVHLGNALEKCLSECDLVILSDYAKGLFNPDVLNIIKSFCNRPSHTVKILVDPKPVNIDHFQNSFLLTPNAKEAGQSVGMAPPKTKEDIVRVGRAVLEKYPAENLLITLGAQGMALFCRNGHIWHIPTMAQNVYDVTGAGDTVVGTIGLGLSGGSSLLASCVLANYAAGLVIGKLGTACVRPEEMQAALGYSPLPNISNWNDKE